MDVVELVEHVGTLCFQIYDLWENMKHFKAELLPFKTLVETVQAAVATHRNTVPAEFLGRVLLAWEFGESK